MLVYYRSRHQLTTQQSKMASQDLSIVRVFKMMGLDRGIEININGTIDDPLFQANQVGDLIGISNIRDTIRDFDDDEVRMDVTEMNRMASFLTELGLYRLLGMSRKPIARTFQKWVAKVVKEIRQTGKYELETKLEKLQTETTLLVEAVKAEADAALKAKVQTEEALHNLKKEISDMESFGCLYAFISDATKPDSDIKAGQTKNSRQRGQTYIQSHPKGRMVVEAMMPHEDLMLAETILKKLLHPYGIGGENFKISIESVRAHIITVQKLMAIRRMQDTEVKAKMMTRLSKFLTTMVDGNGMTLAEMCTSMEVSSVGTQTNTDDNYLYPNVTAGSSEIPDQNSDTIVPEVDTIYGLDADVKDKFDRFIAERCITGGPELKACIQDLQGLYRMWARETKKTNFHDLRHYLVTRFRPGRMSHSDSHVHGVEGVAIRTFEPTPLPLNPSDPERFLHQMCVREPAGKVLTKNLKDQYKQWWRRVNGNGTEDPTDEDVKQLINYINSCEDFIKAVVWAYGENGSGFYGIALKSQFTYNRKTSQTGKAIRKVDQATSAVLDTWPTVAKAAHSEGMPPCNMSRLVSSGKVVDGHRFEILPESNGNDEAGPSSA